MTFFPDPPPPFEPDEPEPQAVWQGPPEDVVPGVVPVELVLGRSASAAVLLTGLRAFPTGVAMVLSVRLRRGSAVRDLDDELFDSWSPRTNDPAWQADRLKWGFELADGTRVTNVDPPEQPPPHTEAQHAEPHVRDWVPSRPLLLGGGGSSSDLTSDRDHWLWPLPPPGPLRVVCQWPAQGIALTAHELGADAVRAAAGRALSVWPD